MAIRKLVLRFPPTLIDEPLISHLVREYDLDFNIMRAIITPDREGVMVLGFEGQAKSLDAAVKYLKKSGVKVEPLARGVVRNEARCTECGACVTICPSEALIIDLKTRHVTFDSDKCIACELCVPVCPPRAMELDF